jgi:hypothetical protein
MKIDNQLFDLKQVQFGKKTSTMNTTIPTILKQPSNLLSSSEIA